ncbi:D-alanyl-glycyl endopeptidase-like protein [Strigomonas culicis]|uniref:D-alanyl-glycyl endopeptidase-like protein n=1 Tax=Strigomonas culicis TaxID=28005 RepID=S9UGT3_9TRYP|nr:D-alanyl-glycyl endopeptidase-like protein [Strigomonas culicis]|eukprot:EPY30022.1 D-alanyl-glycyl endopeptidase-like protein [Strigomonas culicis]
MKWSFHFLLLFFLIIIVGMLYSGVHYQGSTATVDTNDSSSGTTLDQSSCHTQFGSIMGVHQGVFAYSNCNSDYISEDDSVIKVSGAKNLYAGLRWQCVEYARRYWMLVGTPVPAYFGSINGAADIWALTIVYTVSDATTLPLHRFESMTKKDYESAQQTPSSAMGNITNTVPRVGDILIYKRELPSFPYGHVAVVVEFVAGATTAGAAAASAPYVLVGEQNWDNEMWPSPYHNYSRRVNMVYDASKEVYTLVDVEGTLYGWMRYG